MSNDVRELERDPEDGLDRLIRPAMCWEAPPQLTANLLSLIPGSPALLTTLHNDMAFAPRPQPKRWYVVLVTILTVMAIVVSLLVAWNIYGAMSAELGLTDTWAAFWASVSSGIDRLFTTLPQLNYAVNLLTGIRNYLYWLLLVAVLWAALDGWSPRMPFRGQHASS